jgi:acyl-CoA reductase-like NAD-dependent aldehyde dehydrogenase
LLFALADKLEASTDELAILESLDAGKPLACALVSLSKLCAEQGYGAYAVLWNGQGAKPISATQSHASGTLQVRLPYIRF